MSWSISSGSRLWSRPGSILWPRPVPAEGARELFGAGGCLTLAKLDFRMGDRFLGHAGVRKGDRTKKLVFARARDGRGGIRTHEGLAPLAVFKTAALNHSATLPRSQRQRLTHWPWQTKVDIAAESRRRPLFAGPCLARTYLKQTAGTTGRAAAIRSGSIERRGPGGARPSPPKSRPTERGRKKENPAGMRG